MRYFHEQTALSRGLTVVKQVVLWPNDGLHLQSVVRIGPDPTRAKVKHTRTVVAYTCITYIMQLCVFS